MDVKDNLSSTTQFFGSSIRYLVNFVCYERRAYESVDEKSLS